MAETKSDTPTKPAEENTPRTTRKPKARRNTLPGFNPEWAKFHDNGAPTRKPVQGNESL